jgi:hypothetical protein
MEDELTGVFPVTVSNMALCLVNNKHILSSILEHQDNEMDVLQNGLMTISLSGDETERDVRRRDNGFHRGRNAKRFWGECL